MRPNSYDIKTKPPLDTECSADRVGTGPLSDRKVTAKFEGENITSDAGIVLLRELEESLGIIERMAECFEDRRNPAYIDHTVEQLLRQRIFGLVCAYEALNDHDDWQRDWAAAVEHRGEPGTPHLRIRSSTDFAFHILDRNPSALFAKHFFRREKKPSAANFPPRR